MLEDAAQLMLSLCLGWLAWKARGKNVIWKGYKMSVTPGASMSSNMVVMGFTQGTSCLGCHFDVRSMGKHISAFGRVMVFPPRSRLHKHLHTVLRSELLQKDRYQPEIHLRNMSLITQAAPGYEIINFHNV